MIDGKAHPDLFDARPPSEDPPASAFPSPRPFQDEAHESLRRGFADGHRKQVLMAPTGAGKTLMAMRIAHEALKKGRRALFIADRTTLIDQTSAVADSYGLTDHGIIQAQHERTYYNRPFQIASAQTLVRRMHLPWGREAVGDFDVVIVDECHCFYKGWTDFVERTEGAVIGLSATPFSRGLGQIFSNLVNAAPMARLVDEGYLVPMRVYSCRRPDMTGAKKVGGEWSADEVEERGREIIGDVVTEWQHRAEGRKTICFGATIRHCEEIAAQFSRAGVMASVFTANTKPDEREMILEDYRKPDSMIRVLVSVEALAKGFDVPDVGCVIDARPLRKSLSTAIQMWGRGLRISPETGKKDCVLIDHSGNIIRFAEDFERIYHVGLDSLDSGERLDRVPRDKDEDQDEAAACPQCGYQPFAKRCMSCGYERQTRATVEHVAGESREIKIGQRVAALDDRHLWDQCVAVTEDGNPHKHKGRAANLYKSITGNWQPWDWSLDIPAETVVSAAVRGKLKANRIAYYRARDRYAA